MQTYPKVSIIVLNYNGQECLDTCLFSLDQASYPNKEIIVVDNGSNDDSAFRAQKKYPHFLFLFNKTNEGFAKGMNKGIKQALFSGSDFIVLFNYDATIEAFSIERVIDQMLKNKNNGLASPLIYDSTKKNIWFGKGKINFLRMRTEHLLPSSFELCEESYQSDFLTGCSLFISRQVIEKIGFLDEDFFLYYEDADYSLRARKSGFMCIVVPSAFVYHREKSNENFQKIYFLVYSGLVFFQKHTPFWLKPYHIFYIAIRRVKNIIEIHLKKDPVLIQVSRAYKDFFYGEKA